MAKFDLADGYYRVQLSPKEVAPLGVLLPVMPGEDPLVGLSFTLRMGWTKLPSYFSKKKLRSSQVILAPHKLEDVADQA